MGIQQTLFDHYRQLFSRWAVYIERFKTDSLHLLPQLDEKTKEILELPISIDVVKIAIGNLYPGKSRGPDGLSAAFYKAFQDLLSPYLR